MWRKPIEACEDHMDDSAKCENTLTVLYQEQN